LKIDNHQIAAVPVNGAPKHLFLFSVLLGAILALPVVMNAQLTTADVVGTVTDTTGAVVPNANVTLTNQKTNEARNTQSSGGGQYAGASTTALLCRTSVGGTLEPLEEKKTASASPARTKWTCSAR
jgi:hypothetical protein